MCREAADVLKTIGTTVCGLSNNYIFDYDKEDPILPIVGARTVFEKGKSVYEAMGDSNKYFLVEGNEGHHFYADDAWPIIHKMICRQLKVCCEMDKRIQENLKNLQHNYMSHFYGCSMRMTNS